MIGSDNITVPIVLNCVREERELCVDTVLRELERNISSSPRPYQLAMMSMLYCLWCLRVVHCSKVQEFTVFNISLEQQ